MSPVQVVVWMLALCAFVLVVVELSDWLQEIREIEDKWWWYD